MWDMLVILREDWNVWWISTEVVPWLLTNKQKQQEFMAAKNLAVVTCCSYLGYLVACNISLSPLFFLFFFLFFSFFVCV